MIYETPTTSLLNMVPPRCAICAMPLVARKSDSGTSTTPTHWPWECRTNWCRRTFWLPQEAQ